jgi:hypothetical protein
VGHLVASARQWCTAVVYLFHDLRPDDDSESARAADYLCIDRRRGGH